MLGLILASAVALASPVPSPEPASDALAGQAYVGVHVSLPRAVVAPPIDGDLSNPAWAQAAKIPLDFNLRNRQPADQPTTVYAITDDTYLYIAADARQREPLAATQHTNDVALENDDYFEIDLWPSGANGFTYEFSVNPIGTHNQRSSENTAYAPAWKSAGRSVAGGYQVTMRIPLAAIRSGGRESWNAQFIRFVATSQDLYEWQHSPAQQTEDETDVLYSGYLSGFSTQSANRPRARFGVYGLGEIASKSVGGSTSRLGVDLSIPLTLTSSFVATLHPDYSNVELDQQTITPTAFARQFQEVRPFFTQGANFYGNGYCVNCNAQELYTPAIPTPRDGFAIEGKQGMFSFAGFDALGFSRNDAAQAVNFNTPDQRYSVALNHVSVNLPNFRDAVTSFNVAHNSQRGFWQYLDFGEEAGTDVTDPGLGRRREAGIGVYDQTSGIFAVLRDIGPQYSPADGYVQLPGIAGYDVNGEKTWYYKPTSFIPRIIVAANIDRYHGADGRLNQSDSGFAVGADIRPQMHVRIGTGSSYVRLGSGVFTPISSNGVDLTFHYHTTTPTAFSYYQGRFGPGRLASLFTSTTLKAGARSFISIQADENAQWLDRGVRYVSWLEKASYTYQNGQNSSFGLGIRRIIGQFPVVEDSPNASFNAWNLSAAFYQRLAHAELYLVYGDANALSTAPQFIVKFIQYLGAEKGT
mgnify:CR=1 FL=1